MHRPTIAADKEPQVPKGDTKKLKSEDFSAGT